MAKWFNRLHMVAHFGFGILIAGVVAGFFGQRFMALMPFAVVGSFLPDLEHFLFYFTYGRKTDYSMRVRSYLKKGQLMKWAHFCAYNHKKLMGLYSHTWYGVMIVVILGIVSWNFSIKLGVLFAAMAIHFFYDIAEDLVLLGKINSNWKGKVRKFGEV